MADTPVLRQRSRYGFWAKIVRAEEHLATIKAEVALFHEADPYELVGEFNTEGTEYVAHLRLNEVPPIRLQLLVGDFAHNLRSALDHLAGWLVIRNGGTPTTSTGFPICLKEPAHGVKIEPGVSVEAMAVIEGLQPYNRGEAAAKDKLAVLRAINNTDKHRNLFLATSCITNARVWLEYDSGFPLTFPQRVQGRFEHGAELTRFPMVSPVPSHERSHVTVKAEAAALVTFAEPKPIGEQPVEGLLRQLLEYVTNMVLRPIETAELSRTL
jgi:hypothetical protein